MTQDIATHDPPRGGADFLIRVDLSDHEMPGRSEQLWTRQVGELRFVVCSVPFFAYGMAVGDEVATDTNYVLTEVVKRSGRQVLRVALTAKSAAVLHDDIHRLLASLELEHEWHRTGYVAIDLPGDEVPERLLAFLQEHQLLNELAFELV